MIRMYMGGAAAIALLLASAAPAPAAPLGPGCAPDRPAIAHHAGGKVAAAYLHTVRDTGRTFWTKTYGYAAGSSLNYGDEDGTWGASPKAGCPGGDYEKVAAGPPPVGGDKPSGYRNVVYLCTNGPAPTF